MRNALTRGSMALSISALAVLAGCDCSSCDSGDAPNAAAAPALPTMDTASSAPAAASGAATFPVCFEVKGMHCNGCAEAIAEETRGVAGVTAVTVSFEDSRADVTLAQGSDAGAVEAAIRKLGYTVSRRK